MIIVVIGMVDRSEIQDCNSHLPLLEGCEGSTVKKYFAYLCSSSVEKDRLVSTFLTTREPQVV